MRPGIYALVALNDAPLPPCDLELLGLGRETSHPQAVARGFVVTAIDPDPQALDVYKTPAAITVLAGFLDEPEELADSLDLPKGTRAAKLAAHALARYGDNASRRLVGEWSLLHFDLKTRTLSLLVSLAYRDYVHYAIYGDTVAVSPDGSKLCTLPGVGRSLDVEGFALGVARARLRAYMGSRTSWRGVSRVPPGTYEIFSLRCRRSAPPQAESPPSLFKGSFEDAVEAANSVSRLIMQQQLRRYGRSAILLSGGLDSTLLSALGAQVRESSAEMFALTSVAPPGSDLPDERSLSSMTCAFLGIEHHLVSPAAWLSAYIPSETTLQFTQGPMFGLRHYLYETLIEEARAQGARALIDGCNGEMSITTKPRLHSEVWWLKSWYRQVMEWRHVRAQRESRNGAAFHIRLSPNLLSTLPSDWSDLVRAKHNAFRSPRPGTPFGFNPVFQKMGRLDTATAEGIRHIYPYRDMRLLRLAASFPGDYFERRQETRPIARALLRGRVPEMVRLNMQSRPFSPDYGLRIATQKGRALERLADYRAAGVGEWLDLAWLSEALHRSDAGAGRCHMEAQLTCGAAEFLLAFYHAR